MRGNLSSKKSGHRLINKRTKKTRMNMKKLMKQIRVKLVIVNNGILDFRIQGLLHLKVEQAEQGRELVNQIESHPHQDDLLSDLRQNKVHKPFSENSKKMIHDLGNVEHFELCETDSALQCSYCLSYWAQGIVYCTCGVCLSHTDEMRQRNRKRVDALSISIFAIKKGCSHGARHGKSEEQIYYHKSHNS